jgi:uncharacterized protein YciI
MLYSFYALDKVGALELRKQTRAAHLEHLAAAANYNLRIVVGSPMLNEAGDMFGSLVVVEADSRADVEAFFANDPYQKAGLFAESRIATVLDNFVK